jgi:hypothetical protein
VGRPRIELGSHGSKPCILSIIPTAQIKWRRASGSNRMPCGTFCLANRPNHHHSLLSIKWSHRWESNPHRSTCFGLSGLSRTPLPVWTLCERNGPRAGNRTRVCRVTIYAFFQLKVLSDGAHGGTRTPKPLRATASKAAVYTIPPHALKNFTVPIGELRQFKLFGHRMNHVDSSCVKKLVEVRRIELAIL